MRGYLLDSHIARSLAAAVQTLAPDCAVVHLSRWRKGSLLHASDEEIIRAASEKDLVPAHLFSNSQYIDPAYPVVYLRP